MIAASPSLVHRAARLAAGLPTPRAEIDDQWKRFRLQGIAEARLAERRIGTRHRAALGLTEQTDAVVIVVSEETGAISIAREGKLSRPLEEEARLVKVLLAVTRPPRDRRSFARTDVVSQIRARLAPQKKNKESLRADHPKELRT